MPIKSLTPRKRVQLVKFYLEEMSPTHDSFVPCEPDGKCPACGGMLSYSLGSKLIDALHRRVEADPSAYGIKGSLSLGVDVERMQKIKEEIEAREPVLGLGKNKKIFKRRGVNNMAGVTPWKICGCGKTFAPRSNGQIRCDECRDKRKKGVIG